MGKSACILSCSVSCLTLCDPMDCSPPGSSVHGISQARILEWVAISFSRGSSRPRNRTQVSCIAGIFFTVWATRESPKVKGIDLLLLSHFGCVQLCATRDGSPPGSPVPGILQARILEWVTISFSRGSSRPRDRTRVSRIGGRRFNLWATREVLYVFYGYSKKIPYIFWNVGWFDIEGWITAVFS